MLDLTTTEVTNNDYPPFVEGEAMIMVKEGEVKTSKAGADYVSLKLEVMDGDNKGRYLFHGLNLAHPTEKVRNISNQILKTMLVSAGIETMKFEEMSDIVSTLTGKTMMAYLVQDGQYGKAARFIVPNEQAVPESSIPF